MKQVDKTAISEMQDEMLDVLQNNILKFWLEKMQDNVHGGFYGQMTGKDVLVPTADKGAILNARILWSFSAAYRMLKKPEYLEAAIRAKNYIINHFYDKKFGGIYWSLDYKGKPKDTKKQIYAIGFAIYGLSELNRATGDQEALDYAIRLFETIEKYSFDTHKNGYFEALTRDWQPIADMRLSDKDENERKTMNTHLHILEPYANLYRVWKDERLKKQLGNLIDIFTDKILNKETYHLDLFFDDDWNSKYEIISYGHDIEAAWLIHEAALVLGDKEKLAKVETLIPKIAEAAKDGLRPNGGMVHEENFTSGVMDYDMQWWVECETVIGYMDNYQYFGNEDAYQIAKRCWQFIKDKLIDKKNGEWYWSIHPDGSINKDDDKAGFWKCPYHDSRMCLEILERF